MALKKTVASYIKEDGSFHPQQDIDMHPLEEYAIKAHWAIHDIKVNVLPAPTMEEEHEWMIEYGADYIKQKREEWKKQFEIILPKIQEAETNRDKANLAWNAHVEHCIENGFDYNTHNKDTYNAS